MAARTSTSTTTTPPDDADAFAVPAPDAVKDEDGDWRVFVQFRDESDTKVVFTGPEKAARAHLEANFPRPHIELDKVRYGAFLESPSGNREMFNVEEGWSNA